MSASPEAAATEITTEDLFAMVVDNELGVTPEQPEAVAETPQETEAPFNLDPELPEDIAQLLEEPEIEDESVPPSFETQEEEEFEYDEEKASLKKKIKALEAKAAWSDQKRVEAARGKWEAEADKFFPLADPASITADSRRGFLREAKEQHDRNKKIFGSRGQQAANALLESARAEAEQIKATAKAEAAKAWGSPGVNLTPQSPGSQTSPEQYDEAYRRGGLAAAIRSTFQGGTDGNT